MKRCPCLLVCISLLATAACAADSVAGPQAVPAPEVRIKAPLSDAEIARRGPKAIREGVRQNEPLYIVDGVVVNTLPDVDAADIVSIHVLNGDRAELVYGPRATRGVIVINTRRGGAANAARVETDA